MAKIEKSIELEVPVSTAYNQMTQFREYPKFMKNVREVNQTDDTHIHWRSEISGQQIEWDCEITEQIADQRVAWRNTQNTPGMRNSGAASLAVLGENRSRLTLKLDVESTSEEELAARTDRDLQSFKRFIESRSQASGVWRDEVYDAPPVGGENNNAASPHDKQSDGSNDNAINSARTAADQAGQFGKNAVEAANENIDRVSRQVSELSSHALKTQQATLNAANAALRPFRSSLSLGQPWWSAMLNAFDEPLGAIRRFSEEMQNEFEDTLSRGRHLFGGVSAWTPSIDISERNGQLIIAADLPGLRKEDVAIEIHNGQLVIRGERHAQDENKQQAYARVECSYGSFTRVIPLPDNVEAERGQASMADGVLRIKLPISAVRGHRIEIRDTDEQSQASGNTVQFERRSLERRQQAQRNAA